MDKEIIYIAILVGIISTLPISLPLCLFGIGVYWPFDVALSTPLFGIDAALFWFVLKGIIKVN